MLNEIVKLIIEGEIDEIEGAVQKALDSGISPKEVLDKGLLVGMGEVGELFKNSDMFVPEVLMSAKTMDTGMIFIKPLLSEGDVRIVGKMLIATVKGDLHDIGKKLVCMMLESAGYEIKDLGIDITPEAICEAVKEYKPDLVGMSAMLTTTMISMEETVLALKDAGLYDDVKVMIGGAPLSAEFAKKIGAHYSPDATSAIALANELMAKH